MILCEREPRFDVGLLLAGLECCGVAAYGGDVRGEARGSVLRGISDDGRLFFRERGGNLSCSAHH